MTKYIFHIGSNLHLAFAELVALYGLNSIKFYNRDYFVIELDFEFNQSILNKLGSTIEVYKVLDEVKFLDEKNIVRELEKVESESKIVFGVVSNFLDSKHRLDILKKVKKNLNFSTRFLESVSAASVKGKAGVANLGFKTFVYGLFDFESTKFFAELIAIQNIDEYSKRDYGRPYRSAKLGMLPPKLAQTMLNIAGANSVIGGNKSSVLKIYDPFCGTGTVLMESMLMGKSVQGSDIQSVNIDGAINNLRWLLSEFNYKFKSLSKSELAKIENWSVFEADATKLESNHLHDVDAIVTEGFLGAPKRGTEYDKELEAEISQLGDLYYAFLKSLASAYKSLKQASKKDLVIVLTLPVFKGSKPNDPKNFFIENLVEKLPTLGYSISALVPNNKFGIKQKESVLYKRNDQKVFRQVYKLNLTSK